MSKWTSQTLPRAPAGDPQLVALHKLAKDALRAAERSEGEARRLRARANRMASHYEAELEAVATNPLFEVPRD